jgi:hypothetical protein
MEREQQERFADAVERKKAEADARARDPAHASPGQPAVTEGIQASRIEPARPQDTRSPREKNSGKGKKTADKWNQ